MAKGLDNQGQVFLEYLLSIAIAVMLVGLVTFYFKDSVFKLWTHIANNVVAACPGCPNANPYLLPTKKR